MKKTLLFALAVLFFLCSKAQIINGDLDEDNNVTMKDAVLLVNDYVSNTRHYVKGGVSNPFAPDNSMITGTWYESKTKTLIFNSDGTTDYGEGYTYKCLPVPGHLLFYNASGAPVDVLDIIDCTEETLILRSTGSGTFKVYTKTNPVQLVTGITLSSTSLTLSTDGTARLTATVTPNDANNKSIVWTSSNEKVASVINGLVVALSSGTSIITAAAQDGSGVKATCTVSVDLEKSNSSNSLVLMPSLYVDGIEAIQYRTLVDTTLTKTSAYGIELKRPGESTNKTITNLTDYIVPNYPKAIYYGPAWPVQYNINPSTASIKYTDIKGFNVREAEVITRAISTNLGVTSPEYFDDGKTKIFDNSSGILTVGIKVAKPELLFANGPKAVKEGETGKISDGYDNIVALQAYTKKANAQDTTITSNYAMLYGTKVYLEGLVWKSNVGRIRSTGLANKIQDPANLLALTNSDEYMYNEYGYGKSQKKYTCGQHIHVWDTPDEALLDDTGNFVELNYNDRRGINLEDYLAVHYYEENTAHTAHSKIKTWDFTGTYRSAWEDLKKYGISYSFEFVDYIVNGKASHESDYATLNSTTGNIIAKSEMFDGESDTSADHEPLVRVLVKHGNDVLIDGYILVHIKKTTSSVF